MCEGDRWRDMHNENGKWMVQERDGHMSTFVE